MARVTLCDLCGDKASVLNLTLYSELAQDGKVVNVKEVPFDACAKCFEYVRDTHGIQLNKQENKPPINVSDYMVPILEKVAPSSEEIAAVKEKITNQHPHHIDLAPNEMVVVPSNVDIRRGSSGYKQLSERAIKLRPCNHPFKTSDGTKYICGPAPEGLRGSDYAGFRGCGKVLSESEM